MPGQAMHLLAECVSVQGVDDYTLADAIQAQEIEIFAQVVPHTLCQDCSVKIDGIGVSPRVCCADIDLRSDNRRKHQHL